MKEKEMLFDPNPLWYKDAIIYQVHVRAFFDSNGDGIGDFKGLIQKLDYVQSLGVNTLWLLPFYPSPLKDGGYDIADFTDIHPQYGTLADFRKFVKEAHKRGLRIITELVINHTSVAHKWFQRARKSKPGSVYRDYYVWNNDTKKYKDARIIFQDFEVSNWTYDHEAQAYYWHRFYSHQPDLNFENPRVQAEIFKILDFWFEMGVDGFRLDAVPYLYEEEGTNCENLPRTHEYLKKLRKYVDDNFQDKLLLAEANQWPDDSRAYFGDGDECHMAFHFPLMPRLYMALRMEDRFPVVDILDQTPKIPDNCQWAIFLRNHDELTLEMVSDEERDYMYKTFAKDPRKRVNVGIRRRLFPLFGGDTKSIELLNFLLFSMPGTPIMYYGDEIGMGDNYYLGDRDGVRTPMQWSPDKNAGFSQADPQKLFLPVIIDYNYHYTSVNVENLERNPSSFLWWKRRVISKRKNFKAFGRGTINFINSNNTRILAFVREHEDEAILVIVNLSRYSQFVELDLHEFAGATPVELFSRNEFPVISENPWPFSMQFKSYFWFGLRKQGTEHNLQRNLLQPFSLTGNQWARMESVLQNQIKELLKNFILHSRWFRGELRKLRDIQIVDVFAVPNPRGISHLFLIQLDHIEEEKSMFFMPLSIATNNKLDDIRSQHPEAIITTLQFDGGDAILYDAVHDQNLLLELFELIRKRGKIKGRYGEMEGTSGNRLKKEAAGEFNIKPHVVAFKPSNTSIILGEKFFLKLYRNPQEGENPDVEIIKNLTRHTSFSNIPSYFGRLDLKKNEAEDTTLASIVSQIPNVGSAWEMTQTAIESFLDRLLSEKIHDSRSIQFPKDEMEDLMGPFFLEMVGLLGQRTADLHKALTSITEVSGFEPEPFSLLYQKSLYQALRTLVKRNFAWVKANTSFLDAEIRLLLDDIFRNEDQYLLQMRNLLEKSKIETWKVRIHGNYKLDKLLFTGKDFIITDFEGEVEYPLSIRKLKHCPLKDVASMLGSFHYAMHVGCFNRGEFVPLNDSMLGPVIAQWHQMVSEAFVSGYLQQAGEYGFIPANNEHTFQLINLFTFERAVHELRKFAQHETKSLIVPIRVLGKVMDRFNAVS